MCHVTLPRTMPCFVDYQRLVEVNDAYCDVTGRRRDELIGLTIFEAFEAFCDALLDEIGTNGDDDVAFLALRTAGAG